DEELTQEAGTIVSVSQDTDATSNAMTSSTDAAQPGRSDGGATSGTARPDAGSSTRDAATPATSGGDLDAGRAPAAGGRDAAAPRESATPSASDGGRAPMGRKCVGNITTRGQVRGDFISYWNQITPENEGKWGSVESKRDDMNWAGLDAAYDYAKQHGLPFKQHTFVWGS